MITVQRLPVPATASPDVPSAPLVSLHLHSHLKKKKKECDFQIELQRKCKLIKKKEKVGRLVALAVTF